MRRPTRRRLRRSWGRAALIGIGLNVPVILARDSARAFAAVGPRGSGSTSAICSRGATSTSLCRCARCAGALADPRRRGGARSCRPTMRRARQRNGTVAGWFFAAIWGCRLTRSAACCTGCSRHSRSRAVAARDVRASRLSLAQLDADRCGQSRDHRLPGRGRGPLTYDLVSLLKDCYVDWPARG